MRERSHPTCVLVSGGIDSAVLLHNFLADGGTVLPLYLRCGFRWEAAELYWLRHFLRAVRSPSLAPLAVVAVPLRSTYGAHWSLTGRHVPGARSADRAVYLPGRNILLLSHAAIVCAQRRIATITIGILKGNPFGDATPGFFAHLAGCLTQALQRPILIRTPLRDLSKTQVIQSAAKAVPLQLTFSCIDPRGHLHCGRCNKCAERQRAFRDADVPDPTVYAN
ncbi:MAG: 7-cyano-7-deazaguanine synthase [Candidatus Omnitrophica bacterium]|nr:7-cyano-7-deazaguanine synthase [Candidatus Omnitrophota bacterium]MBI3083644.1 7-cyano-7-deazaguanine synthase [Candidatus Omnitrophota bacterium]